MRDRDLALNQCLIDKQRVKQRYNTKMQVERDKMNREVEMKLCQQCEHIQVYNYSEVLNYSQVYNFIFNLFIFSTFCNIKSSIYSYYLESNEGERR